MATIISQPSAAVLTVCEPIEYIFQEVLTGITTNPSAIEVVLELDGNLLDTLYLDAFQTTRSGDTYCVFKMNASEMLKKYITQQKDLYFALKGTQYSAYNLQQYRLKITAYLPDSNGILVRDTSSIYTNLKKITNVYLLESENISDLSSFLTTNVNRNFLTSSKRINITKTDYRALAFIKSVSTSDLLVKFYSGSYQIGRGTISDIDNISGASRLLLINASYTSISALTFTTTIGDTNIAHADRYQISLTNSETIDFYIVAECPKYRLHFLNRYGFFDSVTVNSDTTEQLKTKSSNFERSKVNNQTHTETNLQKSGQKIFSGHIQNINDQSAAWLTELHNSPLVFMERGNLFLPVLIEDETVTIKETTEANSIPIKFILSTKRQSQRN